MTFLWIFVATLLVSLTSLTGAIIFLLSKKWAEHILIPLVGFSAGALMGGAFLHLLPEALEGVSQPTYVTLYALIGFVCFFFMERYLHWRHCHSEHCDVHPPFTYINMVGDGLHNIIDGFVIAAAFIVSIKIGIVTSIIIAAHEIPQELGNFALLVYGGFSRRKALFLNVLVNLTALLGAVLGYFLSTMLVGLPLFLMPFAAGGFIYIAASDLIPELHRQPNIKRANIAIITFVLGIVFIWLAGHMEH
jgi:zinc and cadmium transporter